jgi:hypothetical protein
MLRASQDNLLQSPAESRARVIARLLSPARKARLAAAIADGRLHVLEAVDLLAPERLPQMARRSLGLLLGSGAGFLVLELAARTSRSSGPLLGTGSPALRATVVVFANLAAYAVMVPAHEALHAAVILTLGGKPRFGLKLPFAAYCTAPDQLFTRYGYLAVALAPLVLLSAAGAATLWLAPDVGACILLGLAGNVAGAVGDLEAARRLLRLPPSTLFADTETGYSAFAAD